MSSTEDGKPESSQQPDTAAPTPPGGHQPAQRRKLFIAGLGVLVLGAALWFGIPWVKFTLETESTDDAFVNDHVTFVAARVRGQVSRVLVDDNNRVRKGDVLVQLDKQPYQDAVAVKKAAVETARADLHSATATAHGIEAQAWSRRWQLKHAIQDVQNQVALLRARVAALNNTKATLPLAQREFDRTAQLLASAAASRELYDQRQAALSIAQAGVVQSMADVHQ